MDSQNVEFWWTTFVWVSVTVVLVVGFAAVLVGQARSRLRIQREKIRAIEASREEFVKLFESMTDIVYIHDREGRFSKINRSVASLIGVEPEEVVGRTLYELFPAHTREVRRYLASVAKADGQIEGIVPLWSRKFSRMLILEYRCTPDRTNGEVVLVRGAARDITERVKQRRAIQKSHTKIEALLQNEKLMKDELRQFSREMLRIQEEERLWISHELHDEVGQYLANVLVNLEILRTEHERLKPEYDQRLDDTRVVAEGVLERVRKFLSELRPVPIDEIGIRDTLATLIGSFSARTGIPVLFQKDVALDALPHEQQICLYRVIQECLTNITKHAHATRVDVEVTHLDGHEIMVEITDNGVGFNPDEQARKSGLGLIGMRERVKIARGNLSINSTRGKGTNIQVQFYLEND